MSWWHGGSRIAGDLLLPPSRTGVCRSSDARLLRVDCVFITPTRDLALTYACSARVPWLFEVEPIGDVWQDEDSILAPGESMACAAARIVRRFKPSNDEVRRRRAVLDRIDRMLASAEQVAYADDDGNPERGG